jgi:hypothetical protein
VLLTVLLTPRAAVLRAAHHHRNAQHENTVAHIISIQGQAGFYDTAKGWALGMLQVRRMCCCR